MARFVLVDEIVHVVRPRLGSDGAAAWVAGQQLGLILAQQLYAAGLLKDAIRIRRARKTLQVVHRGVYLFGQATLAPGAKELAAVMACGEESLVSHRSGAVLWGLCANATGTVDVTAPGGHRRSRTGICVHRVDHLPATERRRKNGIPITSPPRTLLDFASQADWQELEQAIAEAYALGLASERELWRMLERNPRRRGATHLRAVLNSGAGPALTRSEAERRMLRLIRDARLPAPLVNPRVGGFEVDFLWPAERLIVEVDGYRYHGHRSAFERDRRKALALSALGYQVIRISWRQLTEEPLMVAAMLAGALRSRTRD